MSKRSWIAVGVLATLVGFAAAEQVGAGSDLGARIEAAKTAADHEAIATELESQAKELEDRAAHHRELARHYGKGLGYAHNRKPQLEEHCRKIETSLAEAAKAARALADQHREMAKEAAE